MLLGYCAFHKFYYVLVITAGFTYLQFLVTGRGFDQTGAPNGKFRENICSEGDLRSRIFGAFVVTFLACLPLLGFLNIYKMV